MDEVYRRQGKSWAMRLMKEAALKAGKRVLVIQPDGSYIERMHRSGLRVITPSKPSETVSIFDEWPSLDGDRSDG